MRTKSIVLGAAVLAAGVASSMAQSNVYSLNVVGYVTTVVPAASFACMANPLLGTSNDFNTLLAAYPLNTKVYEWIPGTQIFDIYTKHAGGFSGYDGHQINPGQGFFVDNVSASPVTNTFVGTVEQGTNTVSYLVGGTFSCISSPAPLTGGIETTLGFPAVANDKLYQWSIPLQIYNIVTRHAVWSGGEPQIGATTNLGPAEGFFYTSASGSGTWNQSFTVQ